MTQSLDSFLKQYKLNKDSNEVYTHTKLAGGKYRVPEDKMKEFFHIYHNEVFTNEKDSTLTEANSKITQIKIDLDFRYVMDDNIARRIYNKEIIENVLKLYIKNIHKYLHVAKNNMKAFIMEKSGASYDPKGKLDTKTSLKIIRDGIHIMFPDIITHSKISHKIREAVISEIPTIIDSLNFINSPKEIVDESVIERNNWFLYGSTKPNQPAYMVTTIYKYEILDDEINLLEIPANTYSTMDCLKMFSILGKDKMPWRNAIKTQYWEILEKSGDVAQSEYNKNKEESRKKYKKSTKRNIDDLELIRKLVELLSEERANNRKEWIELGWCLHNLHNHDDTLLNLWIEFSKKAPQYADEAEEACRNAWADMREEGMGIGTLIHWVKNDNSEGYKKLLEDDIYRLIRLSITKNKLEHNDIGKIYYRMYKHTYISVCKGKTKYVWYEFKNHRWSELGSHSKLRKDLSDQLSHAFSKQAEWYQKLANDGGPDDVNYNMNQEFASRANKVSQKLRQTGFKNSVITECQDEFCDEAKNFIDKMDEQLHLIGCNNGVIDLERIEFRDGRPDDLITLSTKIDYDPDITWDDPRVKEIQDFISLVIPNKNVREYVYLILASCLDGSTKAEKLYVFSGSGGNGKSKLIELLDKALGDYSKGVSIALLTKKRADSNAAQPELAITKGRRVIKFQEAEENAKINTGLMKELTGGDKITCRGLFQDPIEFKPQFKPFLICNDKPELPAHDDGTWRRVRLIEFVSRFVADESIINPDRNIFPIDYNISEKIQNWGEPFLWMLVQYYKKYREMGGRIDDPKEVTEYTNIYRMKNDLLDSFCKECISQDSMNSVLFLNDVFREYRAWFKDNSYGTSQKPKAKNEIKEYLIKKYGKEYDPSECIHKTANQPQRGGTCWLGYKLIPIINNGNSSQSLNETGILKNLVDELEK